MQVQQVQTVAGVLVFITDDQEAVQRAGAVTEDQGEGGELVFGEDFLKEEWGFAGQVWVVEWD